MGLTIAQFRINVRGMEKKEPRRSHPRRVVAGVELYCFRAAAEAEPRARVNLGRDLQDISPGGARLRVTEPLSEGDTLTVELRDRRSGESFRARGEVRWCETLLSGAGNNHFVGVQFKEHYSPVEVRDKFTLGAVRPPGSGPGSAGEKRKTLRFRVEDYVVTVLRQGTLSGQGLKRNIAREVTDLSSSGAQVALSEQVDPGSLVLFTLHLNTFADTLETLAAVRWCRNETSVAGGQWRVGLEFRGLGDDRRKMIEFMRGWFEKKKSRK
jgi:hypothetical protein